MILEKEKLLIDQPGHFGDIIICLPIAKWYSKQYDVYWNCPKEYHSTFRNINYCKPICGNIGIYGRVIDMSFGLKKSELNDIWNKSRNDLQSFVALKYIIAQVPIRERWNLKWNRNEEKENSLYDKIIFLFGSNYILCHEFSHRYPGIIMDVNNKVNFKEIDDYNIFDWYKVIINAKEIHCIDSLLCNFVDSIPEALKIKKVYYQNSKVPRLSDRTILINNWNIKVC